MWPSIDLFKNTYKKMQIHTTCSYGHVFNICVKTNFEKLILPAWKKIKIYIFERKKTGLLLLIIKNNMKKKQQQKISPSKQVMWWDQHAKVMN